ncbi:MAG: PAS domain S-box protein [Anaerolineales bacterium]
MTSARILIVDNDKIATQDLLRRLSKLGYEVIGTAATTEEAIRKSAELKPGLILMNTQLRSGSDGVKTGKLIHSHNDAPIIYFSSHARPDTVRKAGSTGPFGYIIKPFEDSQLFVTIEVAQIRYKLESQLRESEQWLNGVLMSIGDAVIAVDKTASVRFINSKAEKIIGWGQAEAIGKKLFEVLNLRDDLSGEMLDLSSDLLQIQERTENTAGREVLWISKDGSSIPLEINFNSIIDQRNNFQGLVLAFRDITARRQTLQQIKQQAGRAEALVQVAKQLNSRLDLKDVLDTVCRVTNQLIRASASVIFLYDPKSGRFKEMARKLEDDISVAQRKPLRASFSRNELEAYLPKDNSVFTISNGELRKDIPLKNILRFLGVRHLAVGPLVRNNVVIGALICGSAGIQEFSLEDLELITGLTDHIMMAISNTSLFEQVRLGRERQRLLSKSVVDIQEVERRRIAGELHDHLGQELTSIQFMLESIKPQMDEPQRSKIADVQNSVTDIIGRVREMSLNLRPSMLDDLGLSPTLEWHLDRYTNQTGIHVNYNSAKFPERFSSEIETTVYRIIQEALTNVARHSKVMEVFVGLVVIDNTLWLEILDKGKGFDTSAVLERPTSGLSGMSERADLAGGYLTINSYINQGTQIVAALPLTDEPLERRKNARNGPAR